MDRGNGEDDDDDDDDEEELQAGRTSLFDRFKSDWKVAYTRCKGVERKTANALTDDSFDPALPERSLVHRTVLRPTRAGEMVIKLETRSLAVPFNFKRKMCPDGLHSFCLQ